MHCGHCRRLLDRGTLRFRPLRYLRPAQIPRNGLESPRQRPQDELDIYTDFYGKVAGLPARACTPHNARLPAVRLASPAPSRLAARSPRGPPHCPSSDRRQGTLLASTDLCFGGCACLCHGCVGGVPAPRPRRWPTPASLTGGRKARTANRRNACRPFPRSKTLNAAPYYSSLCEWAKRLPLACAWKAQPGVPSCEQARNRGGQLNVCAFAGSAGQGTGRGGERGRDRAGSGRSPRTQWPRRREQWGAAGGPCERQSWATLPPRAARELSFEVPGQACWVWRCPWRRGSEPNQVWQWRGRGSELPGGVGQFAGACTQFAKGTG